MTVSFKHTARPEESGREALGEPAKGEEEPQVVSEHQERLGLQGATAETAEAASWVGPVSGSLKENELSETSLSEQGNQNASVVPPANVEEEASEVIKGKEMEEKEAGKLTSKSTGAKDEDEENPAEGDTTRHDHAESEAPSDTYSEPSTASKIFSETSPKSHEEKLPQSYSDLGTEGEELHGKTERISQKVDDQPDKGAGAQKSLSLNISVGSWAGQTTGANPGASSESLPPLPGSFDESQTQSLINQHKLLPAVSVTPTSTEIPEELGTPFLSEDHGSGAEHSAALSEMLDLAGALPLPSSERGDLDRMRRKSMPCNISGLSGSSSADLVFSDASDLGQGIPLEGLGFCVFSEYSGPMPSPADVTPSPVDCLNQRFPSVESEVGGELGTKELDQKVPEVPNAGVTRESSQKVIFEKKDSPVKSSLILEKAVPVGVKPDRLRIPSTSSKDRLSELRLEIGLPGDLKIQAIPEVDIEKDPSREASPIPPDTSFTFGETVSKAPLTPTTPKSPNDKVPEMTVEKAKTDVLQEVEVREGDKTAQESPEKEKIPHEDTRTEAKCPEDSSKDVLIETQETTPDIFSPKPLASPTVIVIPQAQVEEEADEDEVEIAEEPQEIMEDPAVPRDSENGQVRLTVGELVRDYDPKSGDEWSHSSPTGYDGEPATDSSHLSPYSDHEQSVEGPGGESTRGNKVVEVAEIKKEPWKEEVGDQTEKWEVGDKADRDLEIGEEMNETSDVICPSGEAGNTDTTQDVSCMDTDSGWMDSQGTQSL